MAETEHERQMREEGEKAELANAQAERIDAEARAAAADRARIKENQGEREGGAGPND